METININLKTNEDRSYPIKIAPGLISLVPREVKRLVPAHTYVIVTDSNVEALYGEGLLEGMKGEGLKAHLVSFPAGERNKTRETKRYVEDAMLQMKIGRDSALVALGGGVVGDLAGYVAATYLRGIPYVQVPTTIVAAVDSSVGGKTAVDTPHGKNLIGAFYQPRAVFIDTSTLATLPEREVRGGLAEVIKYGVISDAGLFSYLEENVLKVFSFEEEVLTRIVKRSCEIKGRVVEEDERESNLRKVLNFGHTVGHAVENALGYSIIHGEAISIGMAVEGKIALLMGLWKEEEQRRLIALLEKTGLPIRAEKELAPGGLIDIMKLDKKSRRGGIEMSLPVAMGEMKTADGGYGIRVKEQTILSALQ